MTQFQRATEAWKCVAVLKFLRGYFLKLYGLQGRPENVGDAENIGYPLRKSTGMDWSWPQREAICPAGAEGLRHTFPSEPSLFHVELDLHGTPGFDAYSAEVKALS